MTKFPDNFRCCIYTMKNGFSSCTYYYTHYYDGYVDMVKSLPLRLYYIIATEGEIERGIAYKEENMFNEYPNSNIESLIKKRNSTNQSLKDRDYSKDTFKEVMFCELPKNVINIFRKFEKLHNFKISEGVSFNIKNTNHPSHTI